VRTIIPWLLSKLPVSTFLCVTHLPSKVSGVRQEGSHIETVPVGIKGSDGGLLDTAIPKVVIIVLPASLPYIFTGVRLAWGISLIVIIAAEMIGATVGMGYMVLEAQQTFRTERVFATLLHGSVVRRRGLDGVSGPRF
jgi:ABC-type proline/glycine betaine transport system permease subunit